MSDYDVAVACEDLVARARVEPQSVTTLQLLAHLALAAIELRNHAGELTSLRASVYAPSEAPAAVVELKASHRHDYLASVTRGDNPPVCACGKKKAPNGRPRTQAVLAPTKGPVFP